MAADSTITLKILTDIKQASQSISEFVKTTSSQLTKLTEQTDFGNLLSANLVGKLGADTIESSLEKIKESAIELFNVFVIEGVAAASASQDSFNQLKIALESTGKASDQSLEHFHTFAEEVEKSSKFSAEAVLDAAAKIQQIGRVSAPELEKGTRAAIDLSAALGIDLTSATNLVAKSAEGNVAAFKRYGIEIKSAGSDSATFAKTIEILNQRFGGAAAKQLDTYSGSIAQAKVQFEDIQKAIGALVVSSPAVIGAIKGVAQVFNVITSTIAGAFSGQSDPLRPLVLSAIEFGEALNAVVIRPLLALADIGAFVFNSIRVLIQSAVVVASGLGEAVARVLNLTGAVSDNALDNIVTFRKSATEVLNGFSSDAINNLKNIGDQPIADGIQIGLDKIKKSVVETTSLASNEIHNFTDTIKKEISSQSIEFGLKIGNPEAIAAQQEQINNSVLKAADELHIAVDANNQAFQDLQLQGALDFEQKLLDARVTAATNADAFDRTTDVGKLAFQKQLLQQRLLAVKDNATETLAVQKKLQKNEEDLAKAKLSLQKDTFGQIATLSQSNNQTLATIGKAAGITQIAIDTPVAISKALAAFPPPINFVAAALVGVAMAAQAARIAGVGLATGITEVPQGFPNDTFNASLTSGERVLTVAQNKDLTTFLEKNNSGAPSDEKLDNIAGLLGQVVGLLGNLEHTTNVQIGSNQILKEVRAGIRSGQVLTA